MFQKCNGFGQGFFWRWTGGTLEFYFWCVFQLQGPCRTQNESNNLKIALLRSYCRTYWGKFKILKLPNTGKGQRLFREHSGDVPFITGASFWSPWTLSVPLLATTRCNDRFHRLWKCTFPGKATVRRVHFHNLCKLVANEVQSRLAEEDKVIGSCQWRIWREITQAGRRRYS